MPEELYEKAMTLLKRHKDTWALQLLTQAAEQGYVKAMEELGLYYFGREKDKDMEKAFHWCLKATEHEDCDARIYYYTAYCYRWGDGVKRNERKAFTYFRKGAMKGNAVCAHCVAQCYERGFGVQQSYAKALQWYKKHAKTMDGKNSMVAVGNYYHEGRGDTEQSYEEAVKWYRKASDRDYSGGHYKLGLCYRDGTGVQKDFNKALEYFEKALEHSDPDAEKVLVDLLRQGCPPVVEMFERWAAKGYWFAEARLQDLKDGTL